MLVSFALGDTSPHRGPWVVKHQVASPQAISSRPCTGSSEGELMSICDTGRPCSRALMVFWKGEEQRGFTACLEVLVYSVQSGNSYVVYDSLSSPVHSRTDSVCHPFEADVVCYVQLP